MKRRAAVEPTIGHLKGEHRLERDRLIGAAGDTINALLSAAAMNFQKLQGFFGILGHVLQRGSSPISGVSRPHSLRKRASSGPTGGGTFSGSGRDSGRNPLSAGLDLQATLGQNLSAMVGFVYERQNQDYVAAATASISYAS